MFMEIITVFTENPSFFLFSVFFLSLMIGSFLNVVIYRLPIMLKYEWKSDCIHFLSEEYPSENETKKYTQAIQKNTIEKKFNLSTPRSRCPSCNHQITALENIPVISWLFLRAKCSQCHNPISARYPIIELTTALRSTLVAYYFGVQWFTLGVLVLTWALIALSMIDFDCQLLPDNITLPLLWLGLLISLLQLSNISVEIFLV